DQFNRPLLPCKTDPRFRMTARLHPALLGAINPEQLETSGGDEAHGRAERPRDMDVAAGLPVVIDVVLDEHPQQVTFQLYRRRARGDIAAYPCAKHVPGDSAAFEPIAQVPRGVMKQRRDFRPP